MERGIREKNLIAALRWVARRFELIARALEAGDVTYEEAASSAMAAGEWVAIHPVRGCLPHWAAAAANDEAAA